MRKWVFTAALLAACGGGVARADVLVDSGTPVGPDNVQEGRISKAVMYNSTAGTGQFISQPFTLSSGAFVTGIDSYFWAAPGVSIDVQLTTRIGPGTTAADELARFSLAAGLDPQFVASPLLGLSLPAGTYFLTYSTTSFNGAGFPGYAPIDIGDLTFANTDNGSLSFINTTNPAASGFFTDHDHGDIGLRVNGVVPEPTGLALIALGTTVVAIRRRR
jgi:hypothetical protein